MSSLPLTKHVNLLGHPFDHLWSTILESGFRCCHDREIRESYLTFKFKSASSALMRDSENCRLCLALKPTTFLFLFTSNNHAERLLPTPRPSFLNFLPFLYTAQQMSSECGWFYPSLSPCRFISRLRGWAIHRASFTETTVLLLPRLGNSIDPYSWLVCLPPIWN